MRAIITTETFSEIGELILNFDKAQISDSSTRKITRRDSLGRKTLTIDWGRPKGRSINISDVVCKKEDLDRLEKLRDIDDVICLMGVGSVLYRGLIVSVTSQATGKRAMIGFGFSVIDEKEMEI
jgi:hypothetical protein